MCAAIVGAPPKGSLVIEKTTFSPLCATGNGAKGSGGGALQNRPPQARASRWSVNAAPAVEPTSAATSAIFPTKDRGRLLPHDCRIDFSLIFSRTGQG